MASHMGDATLDTVILQGGQKLAPVAALRYTEDQLLSLRPVHDKNLASDVVSQAIASTAKAARIESKQPEVHVVSVTGGIDGDLDLPPHVPCGGGCDEGFSQQAQVETPSKKKMKKKSSGKNKKSKSTGFEGASPSAIVLLGMLIWDKQSTTPTHL